MTHRPRCGWMAVCAVGLLAAGSAVAAVAPDVWLRGSDVGTSLTWNPQTGLYTYDFTVYNTSTWTGEIAPPGWPVIVDYEVPIGHPDDIAAVASPAGWTSEILTDAQYQSVFGVGNPFGSPYVVHWYTGNQMFPYQLTTYGIYPTAHPQLPDSLSGFVLHSPMEPVNGPYGTSWTIDGTIIGDPPLPLEGFAGAVPRVQARPAAAVPEPGTLVLLGAGLAALARRRRR